MRSLRSRLLALWIMLVVSGAATGYLLFESFRQTSNARVARSEELVARAAFAQFGARFFNGVDSHDRIPGRREAGPA